MNDLAGLNRLNRRAEDRAETYRAALARSPGRRDEFQKLKHAFPYFGFVECPSPVGPFVMFSANDDVVAWEYFWTGTYETRTVETWCAMCRGARMVLDIGTYTGCMSVLAARVAPRARICAFEPMLRTVERCKINLAANGVKDRVQLLPVAASNVEGETAIHMPRNKDFLGTGNSIFAKPRIETVDTETIRTRPVDAVLAEAAPGRRVDAVKLDVEGHELEALEGMAEMLRRDHPRMIVEIWPHEKQAVLALLGELGYAGRHLEGMNWVFEPR